MARQQTIQSQSPPPRKRFPQIRIFLCASSLCIAILIFFASILSTFNIIDSSWNSIVPNTIATISAIVAIVTYFLPLSPLNPQTTNLPTQPTTPQQPSNSPTQQPATPTPSPTPTPAQPTLSPTPSPIPLATFHFNEHLPAPDEFYGREYERTTLINRVHNRSSLAIAGPRRIGKTWLLEYLQQIAPTHASLGPLYRVGILSATHPHIEKATDFIKKAIEILNAPASSQPKTLTLAHFATAVQTMNAQQIVPVLCIDECEGMIGKHGFDEHFFESLRAIAQDDGLILIFVGKATLRDTIGHIVGQTSPIFNTVQQLTLRPFNQREANEFVTQKGQAAGFNDQERAFCLQCATHYHQDGSMSWPPLRLQLTGRRLLEDKHGLGDGSYPYNIQDTIYQNDFKCRLDAEYRTVVNER